MKTDDFIGMLASGAAPVDVHEGDRRLITALAVACIATLALMIPWLGLRGDLARAMGGFAFWWKQVFVLSLAVAGLLATLHLAHPGKPIGRLARWALGLPLGLIWFSAVYLMVNAEPATRMALLQGVSWQSCTGYIAALSLPVFVATLWALRGLAPTQLRLAGASAGLLAGAAAASVYCLHCPEVQPPFVAVWYVLGIFAPVLVGALIGPRVLRW
jgi:hypothetical protein